MCVPFQDIYGDAEPADPSDSLDVTSSKVGDDVASIAKPPKASADKTKLEGLASSGSSTDGLSLGQKLFFIVAIVVACALFLRSRKGGLKEKSMA